MGEYKLYQYFAGENIMQVTNNGEKKRAIKRIENLDKKLNIAQAMLDKILKNNMKLQSIRKPNTVLISSIKKNIEYTEKIKESILTEIKKFDDRIARKKGGLLNVETVKQ